MRYVFKFLLANGGTERLAFTASEYGVARANAFAYSRLAFAPGELIDFWLA